VRRDGRLASYARPGVLAGLPDSPITSVAAYNGLLARTGSPESSAAAPLAASPFAMAPPAVPPANVARVPAVTR
jgi:hypothetical protein